MLYLDASALIKQFLQEKGSHAVSKAFSSSAPLFSSALTFAEVHAVLARKVRVGDISSHAFPMFRHMFEAEWRTRIHVVEIHEGSMTFIPSLLEQHPLKAADAIHLSAALWLWENARKAPTDLEFWTADKALARIVGECGLCVFNPEEVT